MEILFSKILSKTDFKYRLSMTSKSLRNFPKFDGGRHVQVLRVQDDYDRGSKIWRFRLMIRRKGKYKKPVLSSTEWLKFVKSKKLQIGDQVQFLKEIEYNNIEAAAADNYINEVKYMVKVMKPVILFNAVIGYAALSVAIN